jgi:hypothetical protein
VEEAIRQLGIANVSKSHVSRLCAELDDPSKRSARGRWADA